MKLRARIWIPGSLTALAPRNDEKGGLYCALEIRILFLGGRCGSAFCLAAVLPDRKPD